LSSTIGIIQQFLHPPVGLLIREEIPGGPHHGSVSFSRPRGGIQLDAFGVLFVIVESPPGYGIVQGAGNNFYDRDVVDIAVIHQLLDGGLVTSQEETFRVATGYTLFNQSFPRNIAVDIAPGIGARLWWLLSL